MCAFSMLIHLLFSFVFFKQKTAYEMRISYWSSDVCSSDLSSSTAQVINLNGKVLMPGLIDCHVHVFLSEVNIAHLDGVPLTMLTARSTAFMRNLLIRGFTTVSSTGGARCGIRYAVS